MKCVEPNEGMRAVFSTVVKDPRVTLSEGTFDDTGVPDKWADMVVVAMVSIVSNRIDLFRLRSSSRRSIGACSSKKL